MWSIRYLKKAIVEHLSRYLEGINTGIGRPIDVLGPTKHEFPGHVSPSKKDGDYTLIKQNKSNF